MTGWPESMQDLPQDIHPFWCFRDELVILDGLVMKGNRILVPNSMKQDTLQRLHEGHHGQPSMLRRARRTLFWPKIQDDISKLSLECSECQTYARKKPMATPATLVEFKMTATPDLSTYGIDDTVEIVYNPGYDTLYAEETADGLQGFEIGFQTESGAISVDTGDFTGRSPKDKYLVRDDTTRDTIWWSDQGENDNHPIDSAT